MRELLLSVASPQLLSWAGFLLLAAGLLGEVAVLVKPFEAQGPTSRSDLRSLRSF